jgi:ABC-type bacteriocin/lantibiotic exporter with double-glycine peptidase domain
MRRRVPFLPQMELAECGLAAVGMILNFFGRGTHLHELRQRYPVGRDGLSSKRLLEVAKGEGLAYRILKIEPEDLRADVSFPCILHWNMNHYVVAESAGPTGLTVLDPAVGRRSVPWQEVDGALTGICFELQPDETFASRKMSRVRLPLLEFLDGYKLVVFVVLASTVLLDLLSFAIPAALGAFVDHTLASGSLLSFAIIAASAASVAAVHSALSAARKRVLEGVRVPVDRRFGAFLARRLSALDMPFFLGRSLSLVIDRFRTALSLRESGLALVEAFFEIGVVFTYLVVVLFYEPRLALAMALACVVRLALSLLALRTFTHHARSSFISACKLDAAIDRAFAEREATRALGLDRYFLRRLEHAQRPVIEARWKQRTSMARFGLANVLFDHVFMAALLVLGGLLVVRRDLTLGSLSCILAAHALLSSKTASIGRAIAVASFAAPTLRGIEDVVTADLEPAGEVRHVPRGAIELRDVTFAFADESAPTLRNVSLRVRPGEHVALVGRSGSGKSTILRVVLGLLQPRAGAILFDGLALERLDREHLREHLAFVPPAATILEGTIASNVVLASGSSQEECLSVLRRLGLGETLSALPDGVRTSVDFGASGLSTGQTQRLLLARALLRRAAVIVMDEATSALDEATEAQALGELRRTNATLISATHRPAVMRAADRIIVLSRGKVVAEGTFAYLWSRSAEFRDLFEDDGLEKGERCAG